MLPPFDPRYSLARLTMRNILDLDRYPIDRLNSRDGMRLVERCKSDFHERGMFDLEGFVHADAVERAADELGPVVDSIGYRHARRHNIYFKDQIAGLAADHPALEKLETVNYTLCGDQLVGTMIERIYEWPPLLDFLAQAMGKKRLHVMADPLARLNLIAYKPGGALNWHFDRSHFTTTLLIRAATSGGEFQYRSNLRSDSDPNYEGVARMLRGEDPRVNSQMLTAGTLNVFAGKNTAHRVTAVGGHQSRLIAVFSYYDAAGVTFSSAERIGFYGRDH